MWNIVILVIKQESHYEKGPLKKGIRSTQNISVSNYRFNMKRRFHETLIFTAFSNVINNTLIFAKQYKSNRTVLQIATAVWTKSLFVIKKYNIAKSNEARYLLTCVLEDKFLTVLSILMQNILLKITWKQWFVASNKLCVYIWSCITFLFLLILIKVACIDDLSAMCQDNVSFVAFDMQSYEYCATIDTTDAPSRKECKQISWRLILIWIIP